MTHNPVFIPVLEIGTALKVSLYKKAHFILVQIHLAHVIAVIIIVHIVSAAFAVGGFRLFHLHNPFKFLFYFLLCHGNDGGASMGTGVGIFEL